MPSPAGWAVRPWSAWSRAPPGRWRTGRFSGLPRHCWSGKLRTEAGEKRRDSLPGQGDKVLHRTPQQAADLPSRLRRGCPLRLLLPGLPIRFFCLRLILHLFGSSSLFLFPLALELCAAERGARCFLRGGRHELSRRPAQAEGVARAPCGHGDAASAAGSGKEGAGGCAKQRTGSKLPASRLLPSAPGKRSSLIASRDVQAGFAF